MNINDTLQAISINDVVILKGQLQHVGRCNLSSLSKQI